MVEQRLPEGRIFQVPAHGFFDTGLEGFLRLPAEFGFQLGGIDGISGSLSWAVFHEGAV